MKTGHKPSGPRCALASLIAEPMDSDEIKRRGWAEDGILVVALDDPRLGNFDRTIIQALGRRLYGDERGVNGRRR